jgi:putative FmdB family regulatory protein
MPTYEYACRDCGQHLEVVQSFRDDPLETCEHCGGRLRKVFSAAGIIFKGSGYYVTDTRSERSRASSTSGSAATSDGAAAGSSSSSGSAGDSASSSSQTAASTDAKSA